MNLSVRSVHRDLGYLYVGVLISFAFSGIFLNHRDSWDPKQYTFAETRFVIDARLMNVSQATVAEIAQKLGFIDKLKRYALNDSIVKVSYEFHDVTVDLPRRQGIVVEYRTTPVLGHLTRLHKSNSLWWIFYSDAFGASVLIISVTGLFMLAVSKASGNEVGSLQLPEFYFHCYSSSLSCEI